MTIKQEFESLLNQNVRKGSNAFRNIAMTLFFFGFGDENWPTLVETSRRFSEGEKDMSRERVRQIVNATLRDKEKVKELPSIKAASELLLSNLTKSPTEIIAVLAEAGLVEPDMPLKGLLNLMHMIDINKDVDIYTDELVACTRYNIDTSAYLLVLEKTYAKDLRAALMKAKVFPGCVGITRLSLFLTNYPKYAQYQDMLLKIFNVDDNYWVEEHNGELYFVNESYENKMFNIFEKVANVAARANLDNLSQSIAKAFQGRAVKKGNAYPDADVIKSYMQSSRFVTVQDGTAQLNVEARELNEIERDMIAYMESKDFITAKELATHLASKNHSVANAQKTAFNSPMLVRKSSEQGIQVSLMH